MDLREDAGMIANLGKNGQKPVECATACLPPTLLSVGAPPVRIRRAHSPRCAHNAIVHASAQQHDDVDVVFIRFTQPAVGVLSG